MSILIPGLSGGTTALILKIYNPIMDSLINLFKDVKKNCLFLGLVCAGALTGFFVSAIPVKLLLDNYSTEFSYAVIGIIIGSVPIFTAEITKRPFRNLFLILIGVGITLISEKLNNFVLFRQTNTLAIILISVLMASALILPGISITNILISFGMYELFISAVRKPDFVFLGKVSFFLLIAIIAQAKLLNYTYKKYPVSFNMMILGMLIATIKQVNDEIVCDVGLVKKLFLILSGFTCSFVFAFVEKRAHRF